MNFVNQYETWLDELLPKLLRHHPPIFIDIGANTGQTLLKVLPHYPDTRYYAIEPNPVCIDYLRTLCDLNGFRNVILKPTALSNRSGETKLLLRYADDLLATTTSGFRKFTRYSSEVTVLTTTGDQLFTQLSLQRIDVIKVDVEGGEADVIDGLKNTLAQYQPAVLCEVLPILSTDEEVTRFRTQNANRLLTSMQAIRYHVYNVSTKKLIREAKDLSTSLEACNYLMLPEGSTLEW